MDIEEMKEAKRQAEKNILHELQEFKKKTGLVTTLIDITIVNTPSGNMDMIAADMHSRL
jgi:hypothetical protein